MSIERRGDLKKIGTALAGLLQADTCSFHVEVDDRGSKSFEKIEPFSDLDI